MPNELEYLLANDKQLLATKSTRVVFAKDQKIIQEGAPSKAVYFLREGTARIHRNGMNPGARLATLSAGDICGEMAFLEGVSASASVIADGPVTADAIETAVSIASAVTGPSAITDALALTPSRNAISPQMSPAERVASRAPGFMPFRWMRAVPSRKKYTALLGAPS